MISRSNTISDDRRANQQAIDAGRVIRFASDFQAEAFENGVVKVFIIKGVNAMDHDLKTKILEILDRHRLMVVATNRPDGWPQATTVGYVNIGLTLYFWCRPRSQKASNLTCDSRISLAIGDEGSDPMTIDGLSMAAEAKLENGSAEISKATSLLYLKYPAHGPFRAFEHNETLIYRVTPKVISVIGYVKGFGHTELITVDAGD